MRRAKFNERLAESVRSATAVFARRWTWAVMVVMAGCGDPSSVPACPDGSPRNEYRLCVKSPPSDPAPVPDEPEPWPSESPSPKPKPCSIKLAEAKLNEVLIDPDGIDGGKEQLELLVTQSGSLDGLYLGIRNSHLAPVHLIVPLMGQVQVGSLITVDDLYTTSIPLGCAAYNGCLRNGGGVVELRGCEDEILDVVDWGDASATARELRSGFSLSLCGTNDQWLLSSPTFGEPNRSWRDALACPVPCARPVFFWINEILYDLPGADDGGEFIELLGPPNYQLDGIRVYGVNGGDGKPLFAPMVLQGSTDKDGFFLIAGSDYPDRDAALPTQLQNGPEALLVEDCDGLRLDAITWGGNSSLLSEYNEASPILTPGLSLGRYPNGAADRPGMENFRGMRPTPRAANLSQ